MTEGRSVKKTNVRARTLQARQGGPGVTSVVQGNRTVHTTNMGRRVGYVGGQAGAALRNPGASHTKLVVENGNQVITAFPTVP